MNPFVVSPERFDLLIVTGGRELPIETAPTLAGFLKNQGNLIALGTPAVRRPRPPGERRLDEARRNPGQTERRFSRQGVL
jgi:hypothetical protein